MCRKVLYFVLLAGLVDNASAGVVFVKQVTAASESSQGTVPTINNSGMIGDLHDNRYDTLWMTAVGASGSGYTNPHPGTYNPGSGAWTWIKFNFNDVYHLGELWVWNYNENTGRGFKNVVIEYTSDGATWKKLGDYVFAQALGTTNYAHNTTIHFNGVEANSVIITTKKGVNTGNWGDNNPLYGPLFGLSEVRFYYVHGSNASEPKPVNGAISMPLDTTLSWTAGVGAMSHNVYFGTTSPGTFRGNQTATTFNPGPLAAGTTYYWRIDEVNGPNTVTGTVWKFKTCSGSLALKLNRGITIDRQFLRVPPEPGSTILPIDIQIIKSMGFEFVKVLANPACFMSGSTINSSKMWYLDEIVNRVLAEGLPVVVSLHPETEFKTTYLGTPGGFTNLLGFYKDFAAYMAARWDPNKLAFQLMSEPCNNYQDWNIMQPQIWRAIRTTMPGHTLILVADQFSIIDAMVKVNPDLIDDDNVYYSFTTYLPYIFTFQGSKWSTNYFPWIKNVPYPSMTPKDPNQYILPGCPNNLSIEAHIILNEYFAIPWDMNQQRALLKPVTDWNNAHGGKLKILCAEFGSLDRQMAPAGGGCNPPDRIQFIHDRRQAFEELNIGWTYWSYNETFTVFNPNLRVVCGKSPSYDWVDANMLDALGLLPHTEK